MIQKTSETNPNFLYFTSGENFRLLFHAGTHGDEWEVISLVEEMLKKHEGKLPSFMFVPEVSPTAVLAKTRVNGKRNDINRIFFSNSKDSEVQENIKILEGNSFELLVSFHEDPTNEEYYVYDNDKGVKENQNILNHIKKLKSAGVKLLSGIDDEEDPVLGNKFAEGYKKFIHEKEKTESGMIDTWALNRGIIKGSVVPEIPGKVNIKQKKLIVESFFEEVLLKWKA